MRKQQFMKAIEAGFVEKHSARKSILTSVLLLLWIFFASSAGAHTLGQSYLFVNIQESGLSGRLELPIDSLQIAVSEENPGFTLDDTEVTDSQWATIESYIRSHLRISQANGEYQINFGERSALEIEIAKFLVVEFDAPAPGPIPDNILFHYSAIFHAIEDHRIGLVVESNYKTGQKDNHIQLSNFFAPGRESYSLDTRGSSWFKTLYGFVVEGIIHISIGIDHVLFIVTLLLMSVVARAGSHYQAVDSLGPAVFNVFKLVTLFTIAHTITLFLGLKGWVDLPSRIVEPVIALSIVVVALNNIFPLFNRRVGIVIFAFGLFHGLGFAAVLLDLTLAPGSKLLSLLGFNIGVELGQLLIVTMLFPILFLIRNRAWYNAIVLRACSFCIAMIGLWWFVTRAFGLEF